MASSSLEKRLAHRRRVVFADPAGAPWPAVLRRCAIRLPSIRDIAARSRWGVLHALRTTAASGGWHDPIDAISSALRQRVRAETSASMIIMRGLPGADGRGLG